MPKAAGKACAFGRCAAIHWNKGTFCDKHSAPGKGGRGGKACSTRGCAAVHSNERSLCNFHKEQAAREHDRRRGSSTRRGYGYKWQKYTKRFLRMHPVCACGCGRAATAVDHIQPVSGPEDPLFWDETNHQALSKGCHSRKTRRETRNRKKKQ